MMCLEAVSQLPYSRAREYRRSFNIAEACSENLHAWIDPQSNVTDLSSNVFALAVTVGPDEKDIGTPSLGFDIGCNSLLILSPVSSPRYIQFITHVRHERHNRRLEQIGWLTGHPFPVALDEVGLLDVAGYAREGDRGLAPSLEVVVEFVVLDP
jgi:hypothetical protein